MKKKKAKPLISWSPGFRLLSFLVYHFTIIPLTIALPLVYGIRVKGRKNFKGLRKGILAANHCQYLEPAMCAWAIWPQRAFFSAEENNLRRKDIGWLNKLQRGFAIPDDTPMAIAGPIKEALHRRWFVHFYPEGVLHWRNQEPGVFLDGCFFFAILNDVPVIPITEVLKDRPIRRLLPWWPPQTTFVIGEPIPPRSFREKGIPRREEVRRLSQHVRNVMIETIHRHGGCKTLAERQKNELPQRFQKFR